MNQPNLIDFNQRVPAGVVDTSVEFFLHENNVMCMYDGQRYEFDNLPSNIVSIIDQDMSQNPKAIAALVDWGFEDLSSQMKQYIACRHGGYDSRPDICVDGTVQPAEYVSCGRRGSCPYEGKLCTALQISERAYLNQHEIEMLKEIGRGSLDKEIADSLNISEHTVRHRKDSICKKANITRKPLLMKLACKLGLTETE